MSGLLQLASRRWIGRLPPGRGRPAGRGSSAARWSPARRRRAPGVIAPAISWTDAKSTSPTRASSAVPALITLIPTSTTVTPGFSIDPVIRPGWPAATTTMSAFARCPARSGVREWQTVTVASSRVRRTAAGLPTTFDRPTTTALRPRSSIPDRFSSSTAAWAVVGTKPGWPWSSRPALSGWIPSTSLAGSIASVTTDSGISGGSGIWTMIPLTNGSPLSSRIRRRKLGARDLAGELDHPALDPDVPAGPQDLLEIDGRWGISADDDHGEPGRIAVELAEGRDLGGDTRANLRRDRGAEQESRFARLGHSVRRLRPSAALSSPLATISRVIRDISSISPRSDSTWARMSAAYASSPTIGRLTRTFAPAPCAAAPARRHATARSLEALRLQRPASDSAATITSRQASTQARGTFAAVRAAARSAVVRAACSASVSLGSFKAAAKSA